MERILLQLQYNGANFQGFQIQNEGRTVQYELERILKRMHKQFVRIHPSSRTDKGVHARMQYVHFDTPLSIPESKWQHAFNSALPDDIYITQVTKISEHFHSRYDCIGKAYRYKVYVAEHRNVMHSGQITHIKTKLDVKTMNSAAQHFLGTHDFTSFCSAKTEIENKERTLYRFEVTETAEGYDFYVIGSGFLYNMVRIMVQYLIDVGTGQKDGDSIPAIIQAQDRTKAGKTAPAEGLYLEKIYLDTETLKQDIPQGTAIIFKNQKHKMNGEQL
ncbi:tRNA pseudouridine(38-40) synthase TruA [Macrococcus caseolyticus]|uniref:tRNA pseudouridine synthase A n=2 Tax=Macrococcoides caseolyticum TaxID=69966 RepID=A0A1S7BH33_9STAP|nr:tRNA pseudouridine(38-40) synthase TruA [Macrococcus caseolyticus]AQX82913.1 tRNA pseudouridine(38,39,40) synthase A [Macrococcus caseolyticus]AQX82941.1 tRNA pseudouridine(38,39,40) synthase A [Macrococcus caseolyticus]MDJ1089194.1 tRNA pseudouridine(38-40) synthase TruA [Macrococcus caseolyticus]MDJ1091590.1 tRNA pseudouridine(38-40) synthase TruA [Macrococcus caseolyticus]MDJ1109455.1 tRNA pseudouridine(38-40) synthase TruA [Macrococcus caseolyticus]